VLIISTSSCGENDLVHGEDIADIGVAGIGLALARRVGDHFAHALGGLFGRGGEFDMIVQTLAHLILTVYADNLQHLGMLDLRLDQHLRIVAIVKRTHDLARKFDVRSLVNADGTTSVL
jgi:hypothetical protein